MMRSALTSLTTLTTGELLLSMLVFATMRQQVSLMLSAIESAALAKW